MCPMCSTARPWHGDTALHLRRVRHLVELIGIILSWAAGGSGPVREDDRVECSGKRVEPAVCDLPRVG